VQQQPGAKARRAAGHLRAQLRNAHNDYKRPVRSSTIVLTQTASPSLHPVAPELPQHTPLLILPSRTCADTGREAMPTRPATGRGCATSSPFVASTVCSGSNGESCAARSTLSISDRSLHIRVVRPRLGVWRREQIAVAGPLLQWTKLTAVTLICLCSVAGRCRGRWEFAERAPVHPGPP
jgi:hypothetical protein